MSYNPQARDPRAIPPPGQGLPDARAYQQGMQGGYGPPGGGDPRQNPQYQAQMQQQQYMMQQQQRMQQEQGRAQMQQAGSVAMERMTVIGGQALEYVKHGPKGLSHFCFLGGAVTIVFGLLQALGIIDVISGPPAYIMNFFQMYMGYVTCLIEVPQDCVSAGGKVEMFQEMLQKYLKFMTVFSGRALFYFFQASLWMSFDQYDAARYLAGYTAFMGLLCFLAACGLVPEKCCKGRDPQGMGDVPYEQVPMSN